MFAWFIFFSCCRRKERQSGCEKRISKSRFQTNIFFIKNSKVWKKILFRRRQIFICICSFVLWIWMKSQNLNKQQYISFSFCSTVYFIYLFKYLFNHHHRLIWLRRIQTFAKVSRKFDWFVFLIYSVSYLSSIVNTHAYKQHIYIQCIF